MCLNYLVFAVSFNLHEVSDWLKMILIFGRFIVSVILKTAYSNEWLDFFYFIKLFKKKKFKQENAIYLYCQLDLWMSCIYMYIFFFLCFKLFWIKRWNFMFLQKLLLKKWSWRHINGWFYDWSYFLKRFTFYYST